VTKSRTRSYVTLRKKKRRHSIDIDRFSCLLPFSIIYIQYFCISFLVYRPSKSVQILFFLVLDLINLPNRIVTSNSAFLLLYDDVDVWISHNSFSGAEWMGLLFNQWMFLSITTSNKKKKRQSESHIYVKAKESGRMFKWCLQLLFVLSYDCSAWGYLHFSCYSFKIDCVKLESRVEKKKEKKQERVGYNKKKRIIFN
jgi:hypothetical protein